MFVVIIREKLDSSTHGYYHYAFDDNQKNQAIEKYKCLKEAVAFGKPRYESVQLFELQSDPQEKGNYPIFKPIRKYIDYKWIETKFYKKFMFKF